LFQRDFHIVLPQFQLSTRRKLPRQRTVHVQQKIFAGFWPSDPNRVYESYEKTCHFLYGT
jgi:hypothetical protein